MIDITRCLCKLKTTTTGAIRPPRQYIMPLYDFRNKDTGEVITKMMSIASRQEFLDENPHLEQVILRAPPITSGHTSVAKMAGNEFKDVLRNVAEQNPHSPLAQTYGKKDPKSVKVRETVNNVKKRLRDE